MGSGMTSIELKEMQDQFQRALLAGDDEILSLIPNSHQERREVLLGVYREAYMLRLVEFVQKDHELLHSYAGDEYFDQLARGYATAHPSHTRNARYFCELLPEFLASTEPYKSHPQLSELAALEKALNDAFDAPDATSISVADLGACPMDAWPGLMFKPHPSAMRFDFRTNAADIWLALREERDPPVAERLVEPRRILVWRKDIPKFRVIGTEEAMMWDEAAKGVRFGVLCEMVATFDDPDGAAARAAGYLKGWIDSGLLSELSRPEPTVKRSGSRRGGRRGR